MALSGTQVVIIGAGPYGLAAAAHLKGAGIETRIFGKALEFWKNSMPAGMLLRSSWDASHISDPHGELTLDQFHIEQGNASSRPIPLERFVQYGEWFQRKVAADLDERRIVRIDGESGGFRLILDDGEAVRTQRVIVATGIRAFAHRPDVFDGIVPHLASHSSDHRDLSVFKGKQVMVVGGGQSAIESAALLSENDAEVELVMRAPAVRWLHRRPFLHHPAWHGLFFPSTDVGPPGLNQIVARPDWFRLLPKRWQPAIAYRSIRPAGAAWLKSRVEGLRLTTGRNICAVVAAGDRLSVQLDNGDKRIVDHALLATGYQINVLRHSFFSPELAKAIHCINGYPELGAGFESSVSGLHFLGAPAAMSFGPLMRFVSGTGYSANVLAHYLRQRALKTASSRKNIWLTTKLPSRS